MGTVWPRRIRYLDMAVEANTQQAPQAIQRCVITGRQMAGDRSKAGLGGERIAVTHLP